MKVRVLKNEKGTGIYILVAQHLSASGFSVGSAESPSHLMIRLFYLINEPLNHLK